MHTMLFEIRPESVRMMGRLCIALQWNQVATYYGEIYHRWWRDRDARDDEDRRIMREIRACLDYDSDSSSAVGADFEVDSDGN